MKKSILFLAVAIMTAFASCIKEGPEGPAGRDGINGINGINGTNGNANVVSSSVNVTAANWTVSSNTYKVSITYPAITNDIINKGAVLVYQQFDANSYQLPRTWYPASTYSRTMDYSVYLGGLSVFVSDSDLTLPTNPGAQTFKIVVIASSQLALHPDVDLSNYEQVREAFELE